MKKTQKRLLNFSAKKVKINQKRQKVKINHFGSYQLFKNSLKKPQIIQKIQATDTKIKAHEAHKRVGRALTAGTLHYQIKEADGKKYAVVKKTPIKIENSTIQEIIKFINQVKTAALVPANPIPQDLKVAQTTEMIAQKAAMKLKLDLYT